MQLRGAVDGGEVGRARGSMLRIGNYSAHNVVQGNSTEQTRRVGL